MLKPIHLTSFALLATIAVLEPTASAAGPDPTQIYAHSISYGGSGCPQGTVGQHFSDDGTVLTLIFDSFIASAGSGVPVTESRKNCQINVNLHIPQGWAFALATVGYRGYVQLPAGVSATQKSIYYFQGETAQVSSDTNFSGPVAKDYVAQDQIPLSTVVWSGCNTIRPVNINTQVRIDNPSPSSAQITIDSIDGKLQNILDLQWQKC